MFAVLHGILGMAAIVGVAVVFCENRKEIRWKTVAAAFGLQAVLAVVLLKFPGTRQMFFLLNTLIEALAQATEAGTSFVFGYLGGGASLPFEAVSGASTYILALRGLPIVLVALVELVNIGLGWLPDVGQQPLTLQRLFGWVLAPMVWAIGIPWSESITAGSLMGTKTILNEFLAYLQMGALPAETLSDRSKMIMTYAMCGFANPGSLGIMIGGLGAMAPERRWEIVSLGFKSILAGTLATAMTAALVGMLWP